MLCIGRLITKNENLKITTISIVYAIYEIVSLSFVIVIMFFIFGIFFLNLFKGKFYSCVFSEKNTKYYIQPNTLISSYDCLNYGGRWENKNLNFDNIFQSLLSLVTIFLSGKYLNIMNSAVDSVGIGF